MTAQQVQLLLQAINAAGTRSELVRRTADLVDAMPSIAGDPEAQQQAIEGCLALLRSNNPGAALLAVRGLIGCGPAAVEPLLNSIDEHDYGARAWAVRALAALQDPRGLPVLQRAVDQDIGPSVRQAAAHGLGRLQFSAEQRPDGLLQCLESLETGLEDNEWSVRYAAVVSLQALMDGTLAPEMRARINGLLQERRSGDDTLAVRLRALHALERLVA